ncbi:Acg family FMN-binding oxidoreductase [Kitasatospora sp. DSM 101779]|uniref:Acg family FMN-binding oxidoreductase n=1 Tax=Kitasatospora sp. DSM 101779 TaxID=2853165 RepID=UPI0021DB2506|nr:nitroreductase family protein [Kitasatospora sp. DSM 101779]MCU7821284.1 nitroreductase family protein [Kitasatospora sp. DSM 101779]
MRTEALDAAALEKLISAAVAAPSVHNTQPWRFRLRPETSTLEVHTAPERGLPIADPEGRALHISVGAAVFNLRTAARHLGWAPRVRLLPDCTEPGLLAAVDLDEPSVVDLPGTTELFDAIWRRHSVRTPFDGGPVPPALLDLLVRAAQGEGAHLLLPDRVERDRLLRLTAEAERRNTTDPDRRAESRSWIRTRPDPGADGLPVTALGPQDAGGHLPMRDFSAIHPAEHLQPAPFEDDPCIAVLATNGDRPEDWLTAGLALQHVLLLATAHGLRASLLHQAMEWPGLRDEARDPRQGPYHVHLLIRLGRGPEGAPTPRRPLAEVVDADPTPL